VLLLAQRRVAGVGNIYANKALFRANIHPLREGASYGARIVKFAAAGRGTYACETCQKRPRRRRG